MADQETTFRIRFENEEMKRVFDELLDKIEQQEEALKDLGSTQRKEFEDQAKRARSSVEGLVEQGKEVDSNKAKLEGMKDAANEAFDEIAQGAGQSAGLLRSLARLAGPVGLAIAGIGAAVAAAFLSVKENADEARIRLEGLKNVANELKSRTFAGLRGVVKAVFGDMAGAAIEFGMAVNGVNGELGELNKRGQDAKRLEIELAKSSRDLAKAQAERAVQLEKLRILAEDESKSTAERIELLKQAAAIESDLNNTRAEQLTSEINLLRLQNVELEKAPEVLDEIADLETQLIELRGANQLIVLQTQQQINALLREEAEARERIVTAVKDFQAAFLGNEVERSLEKQRDLFIELRESIVDAGLAERFAAEVADLDTVIAGIGKRLEDGLVEPLEKLPTLAADRLQGSDFAQLGAKIADQLSLGIREELEKLTPEQISFLEGQFFDVANSIGSLLSTGAEAAITRQQELVNARQESISALERQLSEEERLQERGLANNVATLQKQLAAEGELLRKEQEKRLQLEKRAARQRLVSDSVQQASQISLAVAKLLAQGASGFLPGLIIAGGAIALLFRILAQAKANAATFSAPPQFREGTPELIGPRHERGGILIEAEGGERIVSARENAELGGRALTNEELVRLVHLGQQLDDMAGRSADDIIAPIAGSLRTGENSERESLEADRAVRDAAVASAIHAATEKQTDDIIRFWKSRPVDTPLDASIVREWWEGGIRFREVIRGK